ncbi:ribbon-helix-helix domain-containing protein [Solwaraspora sp. WMMD1047]|uniref:ribbon-helix-helix domain-containing protein n=1 Tax=Solwaraspora sp. WMMD1047 TaxID=3016102 RepID=UPI0024159D25|nr:ribbon-helix-helix domain-containing protein [Solwaraspora sp. WMMD1047]MDG4827936.1 ribbon-helix-helix domain-containing protein [Solwaraspora sp. WMMD1047]
MKVSVSLPEDDVAFVDRYAHEHGTTRSAAIHEAVEMLRHRDLAADYEAANDEWISSGEAEIWDVATGDGLR